MVFVGGEIVSVGSTGKEVEVAQAAIRNIRMENTKTLGVVYEGMEAFYWIWDIHSINKSIHKSGKYVWNKINAQIY